MSQTKRSFLAGRKSNSDSVQNSYWGYHWSYWGYHWSYSGYHWSQVWGLWMQASTCWVSHLSNLIQWFSAEFEVIWRKVKAMALDLDFAIALTFLQGHDLEKGQGNGLRLGLGHGSLLEKSRMPHSSECLQANEWIKQWINEFTELENETLAMSHMHTLVNHHFSFYKTELCNDYANLVCL